MFFPGFAQKRSYDLSTLVFPFHLLVECQVKTLQSFRVGTPCLVAIVFSIVYILIISAIRSVEMVPPFPESAPNCEFRRLLNTRRPEATYFKVFCNWIYKPF